MEALGGADVHVPELREVYTAMFFAHLRRQGDGHVLDDLDMPLLHTLLLNHLRLVDDLWEWTLTEG